MNPSGASYASTEWAALIKQGGGGLFSTENGDSSQRFTDTTIAMAGRIYSLEPCRLVRRTLTQPAATADNATVVWIDFYGGNNGATPTPRI